MAKKSGENLEEIKKRFNKAEVDARAREAAA